MEVAGRISPYLNSGMTLFSSCGRYNRVNLETMHGSPPSKSGGSALRGRVADLRERGRTRRSREAVTKCQPDTKNTDHPDFQAMCDAMLLLFHNEAARLKKWGVLFWVGGLLNGVKLYTPRVS
jgi:hypothetical protein